MNNIVQLYNYNIFNGIWLKVQDDGLFKHEIDIFINNNIADIIVRPIYDEEDIVDDPDEIMTVDFIYFKNNKLYFCAWYDSVGRKVYYECNIENINKDVMNIELKYSDKSNLNIIYYKKIGNFIKIKIQPVDNDIWSQYEFTINENNIYIVGYDTDSKENYIIKDILFFENIISFNSIVSSDQRKGFHKFYFDNDFNLLFMDYTFMEFSQAVKISDTPSTRSIDVQG